MKRYLFSLLALSFVVTSCLYAQSYSSTKKQAADAFAELDGKGPARPASTPKASKKGKTGVSAPNVDAEMAILKGTGYGSGVKAAKMAALGELSNSIVASIKAVSSLSQKEKNGKYTETLKNDIQINSAVFLKGVGFTTPKKTRNGTEITAFMTSEAVIGTIKYLLSTLPDNLDALEPIKYDRTLTTIYLAFSLLHSVSQRDVPQKAKFLKILVAVKKEIEKMATHGSIFFTSDKEGLKSTIKINGKEYKINKKIFLKPGKHNFCVKSVGYKKLKGNLYVSKGDKRYVKLILIPENIQKTEVFVQVLSKVRVVDDVEKALLDFGIIPSRNRELPHSIVVTLKGSTVTVDKYRKYILEMDLHTFKNGQKYKITHYEHKPFFVTSQTEAAENRKQTKKVVLAVVKKFFSSIDVSDFLSQ